MSKGISIEIIGAGIALVVIGTIAALIIALNGRRKRRKLAKSDSAKDASGARDQRGADQAGVNDSEPHQDNSKKSGGECSSNESDSAPVESTIAPVENAPTKHVVDFLLQTDPLGDLPGTGAERELIVASAIALASHAGWHEIAQRYQREFAEPTSLELIGAEESVEGFAARISYLQKKYTILLGKAEPVALASAPFSAELKEFVARNVSNGGNEIYVLVIDGIAYSAVSVEAV